jgi:hypothetical protein
MTLTTRLLGLAFASADTLVEVDPKGVVAFAIGAGAVAGEDAGATWTGRPLLDLLHDGASTLTALQGHEGRRAYSHDIDPGGGRT